MLKRIFYLGGIHVQSHTLVTIFRWPLWPSWAQCWLEIQMRPILRNAISKKHSHNSHKWPHFEKLEADFNLSSMKIGEVA